MISPSISVLTICGIAEIPSHGPRAVSHVLSVIDPDRPELTEFSSFGEHHRTTLRFHDIINPQAGLIMPERAHMESILDFGTSLANDAEPGTQGHLLVHCHMGVSRSTAAMVTLMLQAREDASEEALFEELRVIRPQAWPNSVMIGMADEMLGRDGRLVEALRGHYAHQIRAQPELPKWMSSMGRGREVEMAR